MTADSHQGMLSLAAGKRRALAEWSVQVMLFPAADDDNLASVLFDEAGIDRKAASMTGKDGLPSFRQRGPGQDRVGLPPDWRSAASRSQSKRTAVRSFPAAGS